MKNFFLFLFSAAVLMAFGSCHDSADHGSVTVDPATLNFEAIGNSAQYVMVTASNTTWTAAVDSSAASWLNITSSDNSIEVTVNDHTGSDQRVGSVTVTPASGDPKIITVIQAAPDIIFNNGESIYHGNWRENGLGDFTLYFDNLDADDSGYLLRLDSISDLNDADPVWTPGTYTVSDSEEIYTIEPGTADEFHSSLYTIVNDEETEHIPVLSGTVEATLDGDIYTVNMKLTLGDGRTLTMYYRGTMPVGYPA